MQLEEVLFGRHSLFICTFSPLAKIVTLAWPQLPASSSMLHSRPALSRHQHHSHPSSSSTKAPYPFSPLTISVSTTNTAIILAGSLSLLFSPTVWWQPGISTKLSPTPYTFGGLLFMPLRTLPSVTSAVTVAPACRWGGVQAFGAKDTSSAISDFPGAFGRAWS